MENPWIGLSSYQEGSKIYGRDEEICELSSRIQYNNQTVVYGRSGIGKSSIINAGVFPRLREENILPISIRLKHNDIPYTRQIIDAIEHAAEEHQCRTEVLVPHPCDANGNQLFKETLWEYLHRTRFYNEEEEQIQPLIVFDQFEEIFTLVKEMKVVYDFFGELGDLLNNVKPQMIIDYENSRNDEAVSSLGSEEQEEIERAPKGRLASFLKRRSVRQSIFNYAEENFYHVVFIIREDYLSYLERHATGIPSLKQNRYCLQPINEEQAAEIILKPCTGLVELDTAELIIRKVTRNQNFILDGIPELEVDSAVLSLYLSRIFEKMREDGAEHITSDLIQRFGDNIIEDFYTDMMRDYPNEVVEFLEDNLINDETHRDNISLSRAMMGCPALTENMLMQLSGRKEGKTGIIRQYSYNNQEYIEFIHDILCPVIKARKDMRENLRLQEAEHLRLAAEKKRLHIFVSFLFAIIVGVLGAYALFFMEYSKDFRTYVTINGSPEGLDEISISEKERCAVYYKLTRKGILPSFSLLGYHFYRPYTRVDVLSKGKRATNIAIDFPIVELCEIESLDQRAAQFATLMSKTSFWRYYYANGDVSRVTAYDIHGKELYVVNYFPEKGLNWAVFNDTTGKAMKVRDNGLDRIKIVRDQLGRDSLQYFYDMLGEPREDRDGYYGRALVYDESCRVKRILRNNQFGNAMLAINYEYVDDTTIVMTRDTLVLDKFVRLYSERRIIGDDGLLLSVTQYDKEDALLYETRYYHDSSNRDTLITIYDAINDSSRYEKTEYRDENTMDIWRKDLLCGKGRTPKDLFLCAFEANWQDADGSSHHELRAENGEYRHKITTPDSNGCYEVFYVDESGQPVMDSVEECYRKSVRTGTLDGGLRYVVKVYYDTDGTTLYGADNGTGYAVDSMVEDEFERLVCQVRWNKEMEVISSFRIEYEGGIEKYRYAMGVDGTPIRCPQWEPDGLCYYKLQSVRLFDESMASLNGISEYGMPCLLRSQKDSILLLNETTNVTPDQTWKRLKNHKLTISSLPTDVHTICYLHILNKNAVAYEQGLRDGDILLRRRSGGWTTAYITERQNVFDYTGGKDFFVLRYRQKEGSWSIFAAKLPPGEWSGAEVYPIDYTNEEYQYLINGLKIATYEKN